MRISEHVTYWNDLALKGHQSKPLDIVAVVPFMFLSLMTFNLVVDQDSTSFCLHRSRCREQS